MTWPREMAGKVWLEHRADVLYELRQVLNYKGT